MKPIFCRLGTKYKIRNKILMLIPPHNTYIEPFVGGGAILLNKTRSKNEVINDIDKELMSAYRIIKRVSMNLDLYPKNLKSVPIIRAFFNKRNMTKEEKLIKYIITFCNGFTSKKVKTSKNIHSKSNPFPKIKHLDFYKDRLKGVKMENRDYKYIIKKYDSPTSFFYLDPPYEKYKGLYRQKEHLFD